jgi:hypothetical protein
MQMHPPWVYACALRHGDAIAKRDALSGYPLPPGKLFRTCTPLLNPLFTVTLKSQA